MTSLTIDDSLDEQMNDSDVHNIDYDGLLSIVIEDLGSNNEDKVFDSLDSLMKLIQEHNCAVLMSLRVNELLRNMAALFRLRQQRVLTNCTDYTRALARNDVVNQIIKALAEVFRVRLLAKLVSTDILIELITLIAEENKDELYLDYSEDMDIFGSRLELCMKRMNSKANKTNMVCALIVVLHKQLSKSAPGSKEVVKICDYIKATKYYRDSHVGELDVNKLLIVVNKFMVDYPNAFWAGQSRIVPRVRVTGVIDNLVRLKRDEMNECCDQGEAIGPVGKYAIDSEVLAYMRGKL